MRYKCNDCGTVFHGRDPKSCPECGHWDIREFDKLDEEYEEGEKIADETMNEYLENEDPEEYLRRAGLI